MSLIVIYVFFSFIVCVFLIVFCGLCDSVLFFLFCVEARRLRLALNAQFCCVPWVGSAVVVSKLAQAPAARTLHYEYAYILYYIHIDNIQCHT